MEKSPAFKNKSFKVIAEPVSNIIIIVADPAAIKELTRVIEEMDARPKPSPSGGGSGRPPQGPGAGGPGVGFGSGSSAPAVVTGGVFDPMGGGGGLGAPQKGGALRIYAIKSATAVELSIVIAKLFPNVEITADPRSNQIIIRADKKTADEIEALIQRLDVNVPKK